MTYQQATQKARDAGIPIRYDDDYICNKCGEPWDAYGIRAGVDSEGNRVENGDMSRNERVRFMLGDGCPCCPRGSHDHS